LKNDSTFSSRYYIATIILRWLTTYDFPDRLLEKATEDRPFIMEVTLGIVRNKSLLEQTIKPFIKRTPSLPVFAFLLTGTYQFLLMDNIEDYAAVNETVEAAKGTLRPKEVAFLNAVLRKIVLNKKKIRATFKEMPPYIRFSHPEQLYQRWKKHFGEKRAAEICEWNNERAFMWIKPYRMKEEEIAEWMERLELECGVLINRSKTINGFIPLPHGISAENVPGFSEGKIIIADPAIWYAIEALTPKSGEIIMDACASPGGKTALIAEKMQERGTLFAMDIHQDRMQILETNLKRLKLEEFVKMINGNAASITLAEIGKQPEKILVDAPCSNTGVIRRKPDIRWRFNEKRLEKLVANQWAILTNMALLLKTRGTLVYSTCSIEPEENEFLIEKWLSQNKHFELIKKQQIVPAFATRTDGAFVAVLLKKSDAG
jgi:16S rRNA (cytosine967-C5)-methyltransferase